jgi:hypothetical protein
MVVCGNATLPRKGTMGKRFVEFSVFKIVFSIIYINTLFSLFINAKTAEKVYKNKTQSLWFVIIKREKERATMCAPSNF